MRGPRTGPELRELAVPGFPRVFGHLGAAACVLALVGCGAAAGARAGGGSDPHPPPGDSASAHAAASRFLAAFDSLQWEPFRGFLADEVTMFFPFAHVPSRADGRAAVEEVFRQFFEAQVRSRREAGRPLVQGIAPRDLRVQMAGAGAAVASFHLGGDPPSRRSLVFRRQADGSWRLVHWHASPPPQAPPRP